MRGKSDFLILKELGGEFCDHIDRIASNNTYRVPKKKTEEAKKTLNNLISDLAGNSSQKTRILEEDLKKIIYCIQSIPKGKSKAAQFQLTSDGNGIEEVFTKQVFSLY